MYTYEDGGSEASEQAKLFLSDSSSPPIMEHQRPVYVKNNLRAWCNRVVKLIVALLAVVGCYDTWHRLFSSSSDSDSHYHDTGNEKETSMGSYHHHKPQEAGVSKLPCSCGGGSVEDAQAMGCVFDILASAWLPPWCQDSELTHEFNHAGPGADGEWTFYKDTDGNETMTLDEVGELGNHPGKPWFSTYEWHVLHCVYNWRKMFRARTLGTTLEPYYDHEMHIIHCGEMFLYNSLPQAIITGSGVTTNADHVPYMKEHDH